MFDIESFDIKDSTLTALLVSLFHEDSVFQITLEPTQNFKYSQKFKVLVSSFFKEGHETDSDFRETVKIVAKGILRFRKIRQGNNVPLSPAIKYSIVIESIFACILKLPCFITCGTSNGGYILKVPVPPTLPNELVRTSVILPEHIKKIPGISFNSPAIIVHLLRQGTAKVFPSLETELEFSTQGQGNSTRRKYFLQSVICLTYANELITYSRQGAGVHEKTWKVIKQRCWNDFSIHELTNFEKHLQLVDNLKNLEYITPIEMLVAPCLLMMEKCLFLVYIPFESTETSFKPAIRLPQDEHIEVTSPKVQSLLQNSASIAVQCDTTHKVKIQGYHAPILPPYASEILDILLSILQLYPTPLNCILDGIIDKLELVPGTKAEEISASSLLGSIDWSNTTSFTYPQFHIVWNKLTQIARGSDRFRLNTICISLNGEGEQSSTIQNLYDNNTYMKASNPLGLIFSLLRPTRQLKSVGINTRLLIETQSETQTLQLVSVICFHGGIITYLFDSIRNCWTRRLSNNEKVQALDMLDGNSKLLEFAPAEGSQEVQDTQIVQEHSIGVIYAFLGDL